MYFAKQKMGKKHKLELRPVLDTVNPRYYDKPPIHIYPAGKNCRKKLQNMRCHIVKNTLLHTALSAILPAGINPFYTTNTIYIQRHFFIFFRGLLHGESTS